MSQRLRTVWSHYLWVKRTAETQGRLPPSTAPCYPTPGKRFLIIRSEVQPPQSLIPGFDSSPGRYPGSAATAGMYFAKSDGQGGNDRTDDGSTSYKRRWSLLGKVLSFSAQQANGGGGSRRSWDEELEQARRETAASRSAAAVRLDQSGLGQPAGPPPPPKQNPSNGVISSSDSGSSTGSAPVFDAATFVFRFTLSWQGQNGAVSPPRDRILTRPRLPAPAQARVSTRSATLNGAVSPARGSILRSESPPPISPGLPPETRRISGLMQTGLVNEARNARPLSLARPPAKADTGPVEFKRLSLNINITTIQLDNGDDGDKRLEVQSPTAVPPVLDGYESDRGRSFDMGGGVARPQPAAIRAVRPVGIYAQGAVYAGRALAEWAVVVGECNNFVDRRRDEGVLGLRDVEVPILSVEGLGLRQRG